MMRKDFNPTAFHKLYRDMKTNLTDLAGKEVIIYVGMTGVGKSTTLDYHLGCEMELAPDSGLTPRYQVSAAAATTGAAIGHTSQSQTLFPASYEVEIENGRKKIVLVDSAGLSDTRGNETSLCVSFALKEISKVAHVKGIVIVLEEGGFTNQRAEGLKNVFGVVSQLTSEFTSETLAFCVTRSRFDGTDKANNPDEIKRLLLQEVKKLHDELNAQYTEDGSPQALERRNTILALELVNTTNVFLMVSLADPEKQRVARENFFAYAAQMPGIRGGLSLPMDKVMQGTLSAWGVEVALQAKELLLDRKTVHLESANAAEKLNAVSDLRDRLHEAHQALEKLNPELQHLAKKKNRLSALKMQLNQEHDKLMSQTHVTEIPLPKKESRVGGLISHQITRAAGPRFDHIEPHMGTEVLSRDAAIGSFTLSVIHKITGNEQGTSIPLGVDVIYRQGDLPEYKTELHKVVEALTNAEQRLQILTRSKKELKIKVDSLCAEVYNNATELALSVRKDDLANQLLSILNAKYEELHKTSITIEARKHEIETAVTEKMEDYQFLHEVAQHAEFLKEKLVVAEFLGLFNESFGAQSAATPASNVVPMKRSRAAFGFAAGGHHSGSGNDKKQTGFISSLQL
ncbi:MAG: hypothetical protein A3E53_00630 [Gammaproteobacteria bacterium RIFCSPHIGHO2_12_FULL_39_24]|nr:MAG: hypothetical protein A3E53_00630 [Gammaproteobacteria bacterium RIFCSPHIGHO2_12_FULL_39_24]